MTVALKNLHREKRRKGLLCPLLIETCSRTETVLAAKLAHERVMEILAKKKVKRERLHVKNYKPVLIRLQVYGAVIKKNLSMQLYYELLISEKNVFMKPFPLLHENMTFSELAGSALWK